MAQTNATIAVNVTGQQQIDKLKASLAQTTNAFAGLKTAIGALAIGSFITNAVKMAAALDDVATASGISLQAVIGFTDAVAKNGGTTEGAANAVGKFAQALEGAAGGSKDLQDKFASLGITLNDLRTLSEEDLLARTIEGLSRGGNNATTMATAMALLGKNMRSVDFRGVGNDIQTMTAAAGRSAESMRSAAQAEESFGQALVTVQRELLIALQPISDMVVGLGRMTESIGKFVSVGVKIAMVVASFFLVTRAVQLLATAALLLARAPGLIVTGWNMLVRTFKLVLYQIDKVRGAGKVTQATMDGLAKRTYFFKAALDLLGKGLGVIVAGLYGLYEAGRGVLEWLGIIGDKAGASAEDWAKFDAATADYEKNREENAKRAEKAVTDSMSKEITALQKVVGAYKLANDEANKKFELDTKMLGVGEDLQLKMTERLSAESRYLADINRLVEEYQEKSMSSSESDQRMLPLIQKALQDVTSAYEAQIAVVEQLTDARIAAQTVENARVFAIRQETDALGKLADIQYEIATVTMSAQEKKYKDIVYQAQKAAEVAIREEEIRRGSLLTDAEKQRYRDSAIKSTEKLIAKERELTAKSRDFSTGWKKAFNEYIDNATNAARQAEQIFGKAMQGIEDLIVNFAKTGKFEWKNFVDMMAEELLRSQVQQLLGSIMGGMDSLFGGGGGGQSKGGSANNPLYVYDVAGGGNPIAGAAQQIFGPPKSAMGGGGIGGVVSGVWDTVKSIGSSIGDFFGGFFANGGTLGAGKWGIAGENGPELISGPANITPMGGGSSVTYNINAVDARSFQQLLAQDPSYIYALTEQGRKSFAGAR